MDDVIEIICESEDAVVDQVQKLLQDTVLFVLRHFGINESMVSISLVDPQRIRELNRQFRNKDQETDILSFAQYEDLDEIKDSLFKNEPVHLGDLVLCLKAIRENSRTYLVYFHEELSRLIIHGMLHIIGMVHQSYDASDLMLTEQEKLLREYLDTRSTGI